MRRHYLNLLFYQPLSVRGWTSAFLLAVHRLCGVIEGRLSHFLPRWLRRGWQSVIRQGKIPWNTPPWLGIEPGRTDSELSHWAIMTRATGRTDSELSHWATMTQATGRTVSYPTELPWLTLVKWISKGYTQEMMLLSLQLIESFCFISGREEHSSSTLKLAHGVNRNV